MFTLVIAKSNYKALLCCKGVLNPFVVIENDDMCVIFGRNLNCEITISQLPIMFTDIACYLLSKTFISVMLIHPLVDDIP